MENKTSTPFISKEKDKSKKQEWKFPDKYKIILLGDNEVGKSSLVQRLMKKNFSDEYDSTIYDEYKFQINYENKNNLSIESSKYDKFEYTMEIIDTGDFLKNFDIIKNNISNVNCFFFIYAVNNSNSFDHISTIYKKLKENCAHFDEYNTLLLSNKNDLNEKIVDKAKALKLSGELNMKYFEISTLKNYNMESILDYIVMCEINKNIQTKEEKKMFCKCF